MEIMDIVASDKSKRRVVPLRPHEQELIFDKYKTTKDALRSQAKVALNLAKDLAEIEKILDSIGNPGSANEKEELQKIVSNMSNTLKNLLQQTSKLFDYIEDFATTTRVLE